MAGAACPRLRDDVTAPQMEYSDRLSVKRVPALANVRNAGDESSAGFYGDFDRR